VFITGRVARGLGGGSVGSMLRHKAAAAFGLLPYQLMPWQLKVNLPLQRRVHHTIRHMGGCLKHSVTSCCVTALSTAGDGPEHSPDQRRAECSPAIPP
jgi:hypothetical protein